MGIQTVNLYGSSPELQIKIYYKASLGLMWVNTVLIILLNSAVIVTICHHKKSSRLYFFLLHLAIADLTTGLIDTLPNAVERTVGLPYTEALWVFGSFLCKVQKTLGSTSTTTSNYIIAVTSLDRAMVIYNPMKAIRKGKVLQRCTILACWVISLVLWSPMLKFMDTIPAEMAPRGSSYTCQIIWTDLDQYFMWKLTVIVMFIFFFALPLMIVAVSCVILMISIHRLASSTTDPCSLRNKRPSIHVFNSVLPRSKVKSVQLTCGIIFSFLLCWMVFFVAVFLNIFEDFNHPSIMIFITFYFWNSVANPILFFIYHRHRVSNSRSSIYKNSDNGTKTNSGISNRQSEIVEKSKSIFCLRHLCKYGSCSRPPGVAV